MPRPLKYTGARVEQYEFARIFFANDRNERNKAIEFLNKKELSARKRAEAAAERKREAAFIAQQTAIFERMQREEEAQKKRAEAQKKREEARKKKEAAELKKLIKNVSVIADITTTGPITNEVQYDQLVQTPVIDACAKLVKKTHAYLQISQNGNIVINTLIDIKGGDGDAIWWNSIYPVISVHKIGDKDSDRVDSIFKYIWGTNTVLSANDRVHLVLIDSDKVPVERIQQAYRDGTNHCVLEPIYRLWKKMADNSESDASRKRCTQIANRIKKQEEIYPNGVPEDKMEEIARMAHRCIVVYDIVGNVISTFNKNSSKYMYFTNTRVNHIDEGFITIDKQYEAVSRDEMDRLVRKHNKNGVFYLEKTSDGEVQSIRSCKGAWAVFNDDYEIYKAFSASMGIKNYGIDAIKYSDLNAFVKESRIINSAPTPLCNTPNDLDDVKHLDVEKAYTQHKHAKYYKGFLGHIQMWAKLPFNTDAAKFLENHIGIFQFAVLNDGSELVRKLGIKKGCKYTLPSPEIQYFMNECGLSVRLLAGCWGSSFDIEYTPEMLANRRYCTWAGKLGMESEFDVYQFKGDRSWAAHLKAEIGDENVLYFSGSGLIVVKIPKKFMKTTHHILAFITSYTRINMLEVMNKIDGELVKVVLDGVYYRGEVKDVDIPHKTDKQLVKHLGFRDAWYYPSTVSVDGWAAYNSDLDGSCVLAGAGGTGKSFSVLTNKGIVNPLYVVPSHVLGRKCRASYGCNYTTIHKLIGVECQPFKSTNYEPGVIFVDELTMVEGSWIEKAVQMYPNSVFYVAGDIDEKQWFQCRNGHPGQFSKIWIPTNWRYVYYTVDMRSKDEELKAFKSDVRRVMKEIFTDGNQTDANRINYYVKKNYPTVEFDDAVKMFQTGDIWIAGTHKTNEKLMAAGVISGYINKNKEIVHEDEVGAVKRGSFTTHSFQGLTIETERVFMSLDFFEYAMLYTSISRVCNYNQIVLVR